MSFVTKFYYIFEKNELKEYLKEAWEKKPDFAWIGGLVSFFTILTMLPSTNEVKDHLIVYSLCIIGLVFFGIYTIYYGYRFIMNFKYLDIQNGFEELINGLDKVEIDADNTDIYLIKGYINSKDKLLVLKDIDWGYIFPYTRNLENLEEKESKLKEKLGYTKLKIKKIPSIKLERSLKNNPTKGYMHFHYTFFSIDIECSESEFLNHINSDYSFVSIDDLANDPKTIKSNSDIVSFIKENDLENKISNSFHKDLHQNLPVNLKVIWNISEDCSYNCTFCATDKQRGKKLTFGEHIKIAEELKKINNVNIDFAGGDPLYDKNTKDSIVHMAKYMFNQNQITITTTSEGLKKIDTHELKLFKEFDISYDFPATWENKHRSKKYNTENYTSIKTLKEQGKIVNILSTVSAHNSKDKILKQLAKDIQELEPNNLTLLRLMPVGKQKYADYPKQDVYNPKQWINDFSSFYPKPPKLHCAFRANMDVEKNYCNMAIEKIGIDSEGNVFACAWAAYLDITLDNNPFYLGNLLEENIDTIFRSQNYLEIIDNIKTKQVLYCPIFSFLSESKNLFASDKIFEEYT